MLNLSFVNKYLIALCAVAAFAGVAAGSSLYADSQTQSPLPDQVTIHGRAYTFSDHYEIDSDLGHQGNLVKTKLALRTSYEYYTHEGDLSSTAYLRVFSLGSLYTWAGVLDVYDTDGGRVGLIEGAILTFQPSKFSLYDPRNQLVGTAYMDHDRMGFTLCDPVKEMRTIATYRRIFVKDVVDHWVVTIHDRYAIDPRLIYSFGAFVLDNQNDFRLDD